MLGTLVPAVGSASGVILGPLLTGAGHAAVLGDLGQLLLQHLLTPGIHFLDVAALFMGALASVHAIASHHEHESATLALVKPVSLTVGTLGLLEVLLNAGSLATGGGLGF